MTEESKPRKKGSPGKPKGPSETGFYRYDGTPIQESDRKYYEERGCIFSMAEGGDLMPDGIHLKPRRIRNDNRRKKGMFVKGTQEEVSEFQSEWANLPEPKPSFTEWFVMHKDEELTSALAYIAKNPTENAANRIKAISLLWEFVKTKPKAQLEVTQPEQPMKEMTADELLELACQLNGIDRATIIPAAVSASAHKTKLN